MKKLLIILFFIPIQLFATDTNYFVDNTGTGDTLSTIAEVNALVLAADDSIFFKKGCLWRETLTVPNSGTSGHSIVFTSYGTGVKPQILGSTQAITWTPQGTANVWQSATVLSAIQVAESGNVFFVETTGSISTGIIETSIVNLSAEYEWFWAANVLYVYAATDPDARYTKIEATQRVSAIELNGKDYIEINGIDIYYVQVNGIVEKYPTGGYTGLLIQGCEIAYIGSGDELGYGIEAVYNNAVFQYDTIHDVGRRGVSLYNYGTTNVRNIIIQNNVFYNGYHVTGVDIANGSIVAASGSTYNVTIRNNMFYESSAKTTSGAAFLALYGNVNGGAGILDTVYIYNNIFKYSDGNSVQLYQDVSNAHIYNNTFWGFTANASSSVYCHVRYKDVYPGNKTFIKNNIFYDNRVYSDYPGRGIFLYEEMGNDYSAYADIDVNYNLFYAASVNTNLIQTWNPNDEWKASEWSTMKSTLGWEADGPAPADPLFTDDPDDLTLSVGSPAIAAGIGVGLTVDYAGNAWEATPSIGAYEYDSEPPTPTELPVITTTVNSYNAISALVTGNITDNGGGTISARGICWSTSANPTTSDSKTSDGISEGSIQAKIFPLSGGTTYHVRAYATNESGTSYGADEVIITPARAYIKSGGKVIKDRNGKIVIEK